VLLPYLHDAASTVLLLISIGRLDHLTQRLHTHTHTHHRGRGRILLQVPCVPFLSPPCVCVCVCVCVVTLSMAMMSAPTHTEPSEVVQARDKDRSTVPLDWANTHIQQTNNRYHIR
jgi:hypothetical protein